MSGMFSDLPFFSRVTGDDGKNGVSPTITITDIEGGHKLTIVDVNGTKTVDILNGVNGSQGPKGETGAQGPAGKDGIAGKDGTNGTDGVNGKDGVDGKDGVNGVDGRGIQSLAITDGELIVVYTDSTSLNLGKVVGSDGAQGIQGVQGPQGPAYILTDTDKAELIAAVKEAVLAELSPQV
jgi:hypothetical protein